MKTSRCRRFAVSSLLALALALPVAAQTTTEGASITNRGSVTGTGVAFPQATSVDATRLDGDVLVRDELFVKPRAWVQFAAGVDLRADSHGQVEDEWRVDVTDRGIRRPRVSVRRLAMTLTKGPITIDAGKQFIRWGKTDIVTPTDRLAPRDFLSVVDTEFLPVIGVRATAQLHGDTIEAVWVPQFTPSRIPLFDQRWTPAPPVEGVVLVDGGTRWPSGSQAGIRWAHTGDSIEYAATFFRGFNHLPAIEATPSPGAGTPTGFIPVDVVRTYPRIESYGGDVAMPMRWFIVKGEAAYVRTASSTGDDYVLYVVQLERQRGEWMFVGGYAGEAVTARRGSIDFAPDRGLTRALVARASYTIDAVRSLSFEGAVRQTGEGAYLRSEYSQAWGQHWRATAALVGIGGQLDDFLGQYRRNSHATLAVRYSF